MIDLQGLVESVLCALFSTILQGLHLPCKSKDELIFFISEGIILISKENCFYQTRSFY